MQNTWLVIYLLIYGGLSPVAHRISWRLWLPPARSLVPTESNQVSTLYKQLAYCHLLINAWSTAIEVCNLNDEELNALAKKTKVLIAAVGPFAKYGEHAFKACAENGTHYLDITGEVPFVARMIKKYESVAQRTGSLMFPQIGIESAPPDLLTWTLVTMNREEFSAPTGQVIVSIHDLTYVHLMI